MQPGIQKPNTGMSRAQYMQKVVMERQQQMQQQQMQQHYKQQYSGPYGVNTDSSLLMHKHIFIFKGPVAIDVIDEQMK